MSIQRNTVLLLKSEKSDGNVDKYETLLKSNNFEVKLVKTLDFIYKNLDELKEKLLKPENYSGIIFSSPRCVNAVHQSLNKQIINELWTNKWNFVVGETTYKEVVEKLNLICKGKETGNANNLSKLIINENTDKTKFLKSFLFPHGNLKTDTLQLELGKENINIEGVLVYETITNSNIEQDLSTITENFTTIPEFVVFFSPSGLRSCIGYLRRVPVDLNQVKFIAIGPVTELAMKEENLRIFGVANNPTAEDVLEVFSKMLPQQDQIESYCCFICTPNQNTTQSKPVGAANKSMCGTQFITPERALATRYANFYNGYNVDYRNDGSWFQSKRKDDCHDRPNRANGQTVDGMSPCCNKNKSEERCECPDWVKQLSNKQRSCNHNNNNNNNKNETTTKYSW